MLDEVLVYPDHKTVIPLAPEPIVKGDGATKNDCERTLAQLGVKTSDCQSDN